MKFITAIKITVTNPANPTFVELDEVTKGVMKRGYLNKWRDREISYASKWGLRYFVLKGNLLSYFMDDRCIYFYFNS